MPEMTLEEFLGLLPKAGRWYLNYGRELRTFVPPVTEGGLYQPQPCCPVTWACLARTGKYYPLNDWPIAAEDIGLPHALASNIAIAADHRGFRTESEVKTLREKLVALTGLPKE